MIVSPELSACQGLVSHNKRIEQASRVYGQSQGKPVVNLAKLWLYTAD